MVEHNSSTRGYRDWLVQRATAVIIGIYAVFIITYLLMNQPLYFAQWQTLFNHTWMKLATFVVLAAILWHAWIGLWTVFTDYVKCSCMRIVLEVIVCVLLVAYFGWMIEILWG